MIKHTFTLEDQMAFAKLSGDYNPMHVDPVIARRLLFGRSIVHGAHVLAWALDSWLNSVRKPIRIIDLNVNFLAPVSVSSDVRFADIREEQNSIKIDLSADEKYVLQIQLNYGLNDQECHEVLIPTPLAHETQCEVLNKESIASASGRLDLYLDKINIERQFPSIAAYLPTCQIANLLAITRMVGMKCPGLHSVLSQMSLNCSLPPTTLPYFDYRVISFDKRFSRAIIEVNGPGLTGKVIAFLRPSPQSQADYITIKQLVKSDEFAGQRALVIGGSRGLGEVTAKILTAGGAEVKITFLKGKEDAKRVVHDISTNEGEIACIFFNVLASIEEMTGHLGNDWKPTHLYYFATPSIFVGENGNFSATIFKLFCDYYVNGFFNTVKAVININPGLTKIFYPSSTAIEEMPSNMSEYSAAKAAGEVLCHFLSKFYPSVDIQWTRLPRLATDQTASLFPVKNEDPVKLLLETFRRFCSGN